MTDHLPSKDQLAHWREITDGRYETLLASAAREMVDEIERLQRENDTCGLQCSATLKSLVAENEELRRDLTRTESAHAVVMSENAHYKQLAADRESALRNCLLLAMRRARRDSDWEHIVRFCREGGVEPSPLRTEP